MIAGTVVISPDDTWFKVTSERGKDSQNRPIVLLERVHTERGQHKTLWRVEAEVETWQYLGIGEAMRRSRKALRAKVAAVPKETRQRFLDLLGEGKTFGEAVAACGVELGVGLQIYRSAFKTIRVYDPKVR
jgi:hypothetical protein